MIVMHSSLERHTHLPSRERMSLLTATILLAYALGRFIDLPAVSLGTQLPGFYLELTFSVQMLVSIVVAGLTATGVDWLLRDHPGMSRNRLWEHWLLPALTAWAIGLPLFQMPPSILWWIGFAAGGAALILVLVAEYIVVEPEDARHGPASAGLTAVSFTLYLILVTALRFANLRLFQILPAIAIATALVSLRTLRLRLPERWSFIEAGLVSLVTIQLAAVLHYWPVTPVTYGLTLLGLAYALNHYLGSLALGESPRQAALEPAVLLGLIWAAAIWMR